MKPHQKLKLLTAAVLMLVLVFGLPTMIVLRLGPGRSGVLGKWMVADPTSTHVHPIGREVPQFSLIDQQQRPITRDSLKGHVWVASFFFSRCAGTCPMTSSQMSKLQRQVPDGDVRLVSFSMDPQYDTPEVLRSYARQFKADDERWYMLTGERGQITRVVDALGLTDPKQGQKADTMVHSDQFILIDRQGRTRGFYTSTDDTALQHLAADVALLSWDPNN
jgi:protein SCO1/2